MSGTDKALWGVLIAAHLTVAEEWALSAFLRERVVEAHDFGRVSDRHAGDALALMRLACRDLDAGAEP